MTQEQFANYRYQHSECIVFHQKHPEMDVECMLLAVDFECEVFKLCPFDSDTYQDESFWTSFKNCDKLRSVKMKAKKNGKTVGTYENKIIEK